MIKAIKGRANTTDMPEQFFPKYLLKHLKHVWMLLKPAVAGVILVWIWQELRKYGIEFPPTDEIPISSALLTVGVAYGIMAALILDTVWQEYKTVGLCVRQDDLERFLESRDERIPATIHLLLGTMSFFLEGLIMLTHYDNIWAGRACVFLVAFVLVLYFEVATELDDPFRGVWYVERVPEEWLEIDIAEARRQNGKRRGGKILPGRR